MTTSNDTTVPYGYCQCGCGQKTRIAQQSHTKMGWIKGEPVRFIRGHYAKIQPVQPIAERFWSKVAITSNPDKCWNWSGSFYQNGYGQFSHYAAKLLSHRIAWELANGQIPNGLLVCHHCDNRKCCNPAHLFLGTHTDNAHDAIQKGRNSRGEKHGLDRRGELNYGHKLTTEQVLYIRERYAAGGIKQKQLAAELGVKTETIQAVILRRTWKWL